MQAAAMYLEIGHGMGDDVDCVGHTDWEREGAAPIGATILAAEKEKRYIFITIASVACHLS